MFSGIIAYIASVLTTMTAPLLLFANVFAVLLGPKGLLNAIWLLLSYFGL